MTSSDPHLSAASEQQPIGAISDFTRTLASASEDVPGDELELPHEDAGGPRAPRVSSSHPPAHRGAVIEVNAPVVARESDPHQAAASPSHRLPRDPMTRVTQVLGSPIPTPPGIPEIPAPAVPSSHVSSHRTTSPSSSTSYSYVSTPPPATAPGSDPPPPSPPRRLRSHVSSRPPTTDREPQSPGSPSGQPVVSPRLLPSPFAPDPALLSATRRALANELYPLAVEQCFVIGVTGLKKTGEDTSRVAAEIALALAETGHPRVLLLEGNLQRPAIQRWLHVEMPLFSGFSEQLDARVQTGERRPWTVLECTTSLHVLAEGVMRTPELIRSPVFAECVRELRTFYDFVVVDAPLTTELAAYRALHDVVDGIVLVSPSGEAPELAETTALFSEKRFSTVLAAG
jgi:Mrp family chromosome partitioning ATPase